MNMAKRIGALLLAVCMSVSMLCIPTLAAGNPTIKVSNATAQAGGTAELTISLENNPGIIGMTLNVEYNSSALTLVEVTDAKVFGGTVHNPDKTRCPYILCWVNDTATTDYTINGTIVTLTFQIKEGTAAGTYPVMVSYDNDEIINFDLQTVDFQVVGGGVTVTAGAAENKDSGTMGSNVAWSYNRTAETLDITGDIPEGQAVFVASYDENGKMLKLAILVHEKLGLEPGLGAWRFKLFMFGEMMNPQCDAVEIFVKQG